MAMIQCPECGKEVSDKAKILAHRFEIERRYDEMLSKDKDFKNKFEKEYVLVIGRKREIVKDLQLLGCTQKCYGANYCFIIGLIGCRNEKSLERYIANCEFKVCLEGKSYIKD